ncbi:hypothetical protein [Cytobacillus purgationiresistens]|uniref:Uncharacterized protein YbcC (UPF0753/DUF2309 family) n=1 Tax=Cytobacillus purgationiresistens TaxID=863449 RepID=A0ABU0AKY1_9BACI|nr:hypothetical protein [Cytobacillus purgationiresistens]MDQ0271386.1 uncharacterized protein YbcC (UPF0753/DUF2309 family) [Cytobacillus purgationiresistens]
MEKKEKYRYYLSLTLVGIFGVPIMTNNAVNSNWENLSLPALLVFASLLIVGVIGLIYTKMRQDTKN